MREHHLQRLRCPWSLTELTVERVEATQGEEIEFGVVSSALARFPILFGVVSFDPKTVTATVPLIANRDWAGLEQWCFAEQGVAPAVQRGEPETFCAALRLLQGSAKPYWGTGWDRAVHLDGFYSYLLAEFSHPKLQSAMACCEHLLPRGLEAVLDVGAGTGFLSFIARRQAWPEQLFLIDGLLVNLVLARHYGGLEEGGCLVHGNLDHPLPFADRAFSAVLSADTLHYLAPKAAVLRELDRVRIPTAPIVFNHTNNRACTAGKTFDGGLSLDPAGWRTLFEAQLGGASIYADDALRAAWVRDQPLSLSGDPQAALESSERLTIAVDAPPARHPSRLEASLDRSLVNPAYRVDASRSLLGYVTLARTPSPSSGWLPEEVSISLARLDDPTYRSQLRRQGVAVDTPPRFTDEALTFAQLAEVGGTREG